MAEAAEGVEDMTVAADEMVEEDMTVVEDEMVVEGMTMTKNIKGDVRNKW